MKLNKNILIYPLICAAIFSFGSQSISATDIYSNLSLSEKNKIIEKKMEYAKTDPAYIPFVLTSAGLFSNQTVAGSLMIQETVAGDITIENCIINKDLIITAPKLNSLTLKNTVVTGDIYLVASSNKMVLNIADSAVNNMYLASATTVKEFGRSSLNNIILTKHIKKGTKFTINANVNKLVNHAQSPTVIYNGQINNLVVNKTINLGGKVKYRVKTSNDYSLSDAIVYDLNQIKPSKGYAHINDGTSYEDLYKLLKKEQYSNKESISIITKNSNANNFNNSNNAIGDVLLKFLPNNSYGIYTTFFANESYNYSVYNIYFLYDADLAKLNQSYQVIDDIYNSIKHYEGVEFVKQANRAIALKLVYDTSLKKHSLYDAAVLNTAVCDGYAKIGYELLSRKFGRENNILVANTDHIWNMLKLNGNWYHIDFTFNDPVTSPFDRNYYTESYLFLTDDELVNATRATTFNGVNSNGVSSNGRTWNRSIYPKANTSMKSHSIF